MRDERTLKAEELLELQGVLLKMNEIPKRALSNMQVVSFSIHGNVVPAWIWSGCDSGVIA